MRLIVFISICFFIIPASIYGQLSFGGTPLYTGALKNTDQLIPYVEMPSFNIEEELEFSHLKSLNNRFAHPFFVNITTDNSGKWWQMPDGTRVWRVGIRSNDAYTINLIFDVFDIPDNAKLFIYNTNQSHVIGAFTNKSHLLEGVFGTEPVKGDEIIVEYIEPAKVDYSGRLKIGAVNHDYKGYFNLLSFGGSDTCQIDMSCIAEEYAEKKSVCKLIVDGSNLCTGTLLNNTSNDGTPYIITAAHCLNKTLDNHSFLFYYNYEVPHCNSYIEGVKTQSLSGAHIKARLDSLDFILVEMSQIPPLDYQPYWSGWSLTGSPQAPVYIIHHPLGDVKKFARCDYNPYPATFAPNLFYENSHLRVPVWKMGTTEGGSSGGGLFDRNSRLIGTLSGGAASCANPINDYFVRFNKAWDFKETPSQQLKYWLDPNDVGIEEVDGFNYYDSELERVSSIQDEDSAIVDDPFDAGFGNWLGRNTMGTMGFAEVFTKVDSAIIHGVYLMAGKRSYSTNIKLDIRLWADSAFYEHTEAIYDTTVELSAFSAPSENLIVFNTPLKVNNPVVASVEYDFSWGSESFGFYWQYDLDRESNTLYLKKDNQWRPFTQLHPSSLMASAYIDLLASDVFLSDNGIIEEPKNRIDIYYNRSQSAVVFKWGIDLLQQVDVYSINGKNVGHYGYGYCYGDEQITTSHLAQGVYLFKFTFNGFQHIEKILIVH